MPTRVFHYDESPVEPTEAFPKGLVAPRPFVHVELASAKGREIRCVAKLDTGADHCAFPLAFAAELGLNPDDLPKHIVATASGGTAAIPYAEVEIRIPVEGSASIVLQTHVGFHKGLDDRGYGLLGHMGFFDSFTVTFAAGHGWFTVDG